jgi:3-dehydroquinate synthase
MIAACRLSHQLGVLDAGVVKRVEALLAAAGLPQRLDPALSTEQLLACVRRDKKARGGIVRFVLLEGIGRPAIRDDVPEAAVRDACASLMGR